MNALASVVAERHATTLLTAAKSAVDGVGAFREWLEAQTFTGEVAVGPAALAFFLHRVALLPYPAERLRTIGRDELNRVCRCRGDRPPTRSWHTAPGQRGSGDPGTHQAEVDVAAFKPNTAFSASRTISGDYRFAVMPPSLTPLTWLGVTHDATYQDRVDEDATCYDGGARARPPRTSSGPEAIDHRAPASCTKGSTPEQLALSWRHPNPARRRFYELDTEMRASPSTTRS